MWFGSRSKIHAVIRVRYKFILQLYRIVAYGKKIIRATNTLTLVREVFKLNSNTCKTKQWRRSKTKHWKDNQPGASIQIQVGGLTVIISFTLFHLFFLETFSRVLFSWRANWNKNFIYKTTCYCLFWSKHWILFVGFCSHPHLKSKIFNPDNHLGNDNSTVK